MRALACIIVFGVGVTMAQPVDPAASACSGLSEGDVCEVQGQSGTCQPAECCTGIEPDLMCSACLQCAAPPTPRPAPDGGVEPTVEEGGGCDLAGGEHGPTALWLLVLLLGWGRGRYGLPSR